MSCFLSHSLLPRGFHELIQLAHPYIETQDVRRTSVLDETAIILHDEDRSGCQRAGNRDFDWPPQTWVTALAAPVIDGGAAASSLQVATDEIVSGRGWHGCPFHFAG